jgi:hypothetical protein
VFFEFLPKVGVEEFVVNAPQIRRVNLTSLFALFVFLFCNGAFTIDTLLNLFSVGDVIHEMFLNSQGTSHLSIFQFMVQEPAVSTTLEQNISKKTYRTVVGIFKRHFSDTP